MKNKSPLQFVSLKLKTTHLNCKYYNVAVIVVENRIGIQSSNPVRLVGCFTEYHPFPGHLTLN